MQSYGVTANGSRPVRRSPPETVSVVCLLHTPFVVSSSWNQLKVASEHQSHRSSDTCAVKSGLHDQRTPRQVVPLLYYEVISRICLGAMCVPDVQEAIRDAPTTVPSLAG